MTISRAAQGSTDRTVHHPAMDADRTVEGTAQVGQHREEMPALSPFSLYLPDELLPPQVPVSFVDGPTTPQRFLGDPRLEVLNLDNVEFSHTAHAVQVSDYGSHSPALEASAPWAQTMPEYPGFRTSTPQAAWSPGNMTSDIDFEWNRVDEEKVQKLLGHLALLAAERPRGWTVPEAVAYISAIPSCAGCVDELRSQLSDREGLLVLNEYYLTIVMGMRFEMAFKVLDVIRSLIENPA